jgi:hypothetical protein
MPLAKGASKRTRSAEHLTGATKPNESDLAGQDVAQDQKKAVESLV